MNSAHLPRIFGAIIYDVIIVFTLIFVAAQWFPLIPENIQTHPAIVLFKQVYMLGISFLYFAYSWRRGGQTIGMKSWRIRLLSSNHQNPGVSWRQCTVRFLIAIVSWLLAGLGFIWILFDAQRRSWHDIASGTQLMLVPKPRE